MKKILIYAAMLIIAVSCSGCSNKKNEEETIIFGDIDFDAETVEISKPQNGTPKPYIVGNNYLNLLQEGLFTETDNYYFYIINYNNENYLIKENKKTSDKEKIYKGNIRNIFVVDEWIYGIINEPLDEYMITMDFYGNNIYKSQIFKSNIRTMISNGEKIYFTVDASNIIDHQLKTGIYSCNMDFSDIKTEKQTYDMLSQVDLITIDNGYILFTETNEAKNVDNFIYINLDKNELPVINNGELITYRKDLKNIIGEKYNIYGLNLYKNFLYAAINNGTTGYVLKLDIQNNTYELIEKKDAKYIYTSENGIVVYDGKYFSRMEE